MHPTALSAPAWALEQAPAPPPALQKPRPADPPPRDIPPSLFNALSWQICLGAPVILYAKSQGASATLLGLIAALAPVMVICQIPAAHVMPRLGYKRLILAGWGLRTVVVFVLAAVPMLAMFSGGGRLVAVIACLLLFNFFRGIAAGAWMPWICEWIPDRLRGRFLSRDQMFSNVGSLAALLAAAALLSGPSAPWQFSMVFLLSALAATISLFFVRRIPDVMPPERRKQSGHRVPWVHMLRWPPFYRLLVFSLLWVTSAVGMAVFTVAYLRGVAGYRERTILLFTALGVVGAMLTVRFVGHLVDHGGNRLALGGCILTIALIAAGWWAVASGFVGRSAWIIAALNFLTGAAMVNYFVANSRLAMATFPLMGRNHFFALYNVITGVTAGIAPILWGMMIDAIGDATWTAGPVAWTRYSIYFAAVAILALLGAAFAARLPESTLAAPAPCPAPVATPIPPGN